MVKKRKFLIKIKYLRLLFYFNNYAAEQAINIFGHSARIRSVCVRDIQILLLEAVKTLGYAGACSHALCPLCYKPSKCESVRSRKKKTDRFPTQQLPGRAHICVYFLHSVVASLAHHRPFLGSAVW